MKHIFFLLLILSSTFVEIKAEESVAFNKNNWEVLEYSSIKPNRVAFKNNQMTIYVDQSASPLVYPLKKTQAIKEIVINADIIGALKLKNTPQGSKGNDDFSFRIGLVYQGSKQLSFLQRQLAPKWIKRLYSLAPKNVGLSHVEFFSIYQDKRLARLKPSSSELFKDNYLFVQPKNGKINTTIKVPSNKKVLAVWISSDGDDTKSKFSVKINRLILR